MYSKLGLFLITMVFYHFSRYPLELVSTYFCTYHHTEEFISDEMMSSVFQSTQKASFLGLEPHLITDGINYQLNCPVYASVGGHSCATLIKIHIQLIAFDQHAGI